MKPPSERKKAWTSKPKALSPTDKASQDDSGETADDEEGETKDRQFVTALARGLLILRCWNSGDGHLSNQEIAKRTGLPKPTVSRLTYTLTQLGYLDYSADLERYSLGIGILSLGRAYLAANDVRNVARPLMRELAEQTQSTVLLGALAAPDWDQMVLLEICQGSDALHQRLEIGQRVPHGSTALGRAYLAALSPEQRLSWLERIRKTLPQADRDAVLNGMEKAFEDYDRYGFVFSLGDWRKDIYAIGVPLALTHSDKTYALNCSGPLYSMTRTRLIREVAPMLLRVRDKIVAQLDSHV
jgi:DNA-binding IclR family transcriptional regulator